jgi:hypothetical protein
VQSADWETTGIHGSGVVMHKEFMRSGTRQLRNWGAFERRPKRCGLRKERAAFPSSVVEIGGFLWQNVPLQSDGRTARRRSRR